MQQYGTITPRIGRFLGKIYKNATPSEGLSRYGRAELMPMNNGDTYVGRRYLPYGATSTSADTINRFFANGTGDRVATMVQAHQAQEGITGAPDHLLAVDTTVLIQEYDCLYSYTSKAAEMYEDDLPAQQVKETGRRVALVNEMIRYLALKACTNVYYGGTGTSIATVNGPLDLLLQQKMLRNLDANHAKEVESMLKASPEYGTEPVAQGFVAFVHTDLDTSVQKLPGFKPVELYASGKPMPREIGKVGRTRYVGHPDMIPQQDAGAAVANAVGMVSTTGSNVDVYSGILFGDEAWSHIAVRGTKNGAMNITPTHIKHSEKSKTDPFGRFGFVGASWKTAVMLENNGWMTAFHVCAESLS